MAVVDDGILNGGDGDGFFAREVGFAAAQVVRHRHVADGLQRELEALLLRVGLVLVPIAIGNLAPRRALDAFGGLDDGLARGVVGVGEQRQGGAGVRPRAVRVGVVLNLGVDDVLASLEGLDADVDLVRAVGDALVGVGGPRRDGRRQATRSLGRDESGYAVGRAINCESTIRVGDRRRSGIFVLEDRTGKRLAVVGEADGARDARGQRLVLHRVELGLGVRGRAVVRDGFLDHVVEVRRPAAIGLLDQVVLSELDRIEVHQALALGTVARTRPGNASGRGRRGARIGLVVGVCARHRHSGEDGIAVRINDTRSRRVVAIDCGCLLKCREDEGELVLFGMRRAVLVRAQPAAARELLDGLDGARAIGGVGAGVGHRKDQVGIRGGLILAVAEHLIENLTGAAVLEHEMAVIHFRTMLNDAVGVPVAVLVEERLIVEADVEGTARRAFFHGHALTLNDLPAIRAVVEVPLLSQARDCRCPRFLGFELLGGAQQLNRDAVGGLAFPDLLDADVDELGVGEARLRDILITVNGLRPLAIHAIIGAGDLVAHALACKLDLDVERAVALVDEDRARILGRRVVGQRLAVVVAARNDLGHAELEDVVLVACGHAGTTGIREAIRAGGRAREVVDAEVEGTETPGLRVRTSLVIQKRISAVQTRIQRVARGGVDVGGLVRAKSLQLSDGVSLVRRLENHGLVGLDVEGRAAQRTNDEVEVAVGRPVNVGGAAARNVVRHQALGHERRADVGRAVGVHDDGRHALVVVGHGDDDLAHLVRASLDVDRVVAEVVGNALVGVAVGGVGCLVVVSAACEGIARELGVGLSLAVVGLAALCNGILRQDVGVSIVECHLLVEVAGVQRRTLVNGHLRIGIRLGVVGLASGLRAVLGLDVVGADDTPLGKLRAGHLVEVVHREVLDDRCAVADLRGRDDLVHDVVEIAHKAHRLLVELEVVGVDRQRIEVLVVLRAADLIVLVLDDGRGRGVGHGARHREGVARAVVGVPRGEPVLVGGGVVLYSLARGLVVGRVARRNNLEGVGIAMQVAGYGRVEPAAAVELLDGREGRGLRRIEYVLHALDEGADAVRSGRLGGVILARVALVGILRVRSIQLVVRTVSLLGLLLVVDIDVLAAGRKLVGAVVKLVAVAVIGREVAPRKHEVGRGGAVLGADLLVASGHIGPGAALGIRCVRGALKAEGAGHDNRRAEAFPGLGQDELGLGAVDEVGGGAVLHSPRGVSGQPLALLDRSRKRRIPEVLRLGRKRAIAVVGNRDAHVDGALGIDHVLIESGARGLDLGDAVGKGAAHVLKRHRNREAARANGAVAINRARAVVQHNRCSAGSAALRHRGILRDALKLEGVVGLVIRPLTAHELLGNLHARVYRCVVVVAKDLVAGGIRCEGVAVNGVAAVMNRRGVDRAGAQKRVDRGMVGHRGGHRFVAVVLDMHLHQAVGGVVEDAVLFPDVEGLLVGASFAIRLRRRDLLVGHAHVGVGLAEPLKVPAISHGARGNLLGNLVVVVVDVVHVAIERSVHGLHVVDVVDDVVEPLIAAAVGGACATVADNDGVDGFLAGGRGVNLDVRGAHRGNASFIVRSEGAPRGDFFVLVVLVGVLDDRGIDFVDLGVPDAIRHAADGHGVLRHGLRGKLGLVGLASRLLDGQVVAGLLNQNRLDLHRVAIGGEPAAAVVVGAVQRLAHRDGSLAVAAIERGVGDDDAVDVVFLALLEATGKVDLGIFLSILVIRVVGFLRVKIQAQIDHFVGVGIVFGACAAGADAVGGSRVEDTVIPKINLLVYVRIIRDAQAGTDVVGRVGVIARPQVGFDVSVIGFVVRVVRRVPRIMRVHVGHGVDVGIRLGACARAGVVRRIGSGRLLVRLDLACDIRRDITRIGIDEIAAAVSLILRAKLKDDIGVVPARIDAALGQVREDVRELVSRVLAAEDVGSHNLPNAFGVGRHPALLEVGRRELLGEVAIIIIVVKRERSVRSVAQEHDGDVVRGLADPLLADRDIGEGGVRELGRHGGIVGVARGGAGRYRLQLGAGGVEVVLNLRHELAFKVVRQRDLGIDRGGIVGQAALNLRGFRRANLVDGIDEAAGDAGRGVCRHGRARQVGERVVDCREVCRVVGYLRVDEELVLERLRINSAVAIEVVVLITGLAHDGIVFRLGRRLTLTEGKFVFRHQSAAVIRYEFFDVVVGVAGVVGVIGHAHFLRRQVHGLGVGTKGTIVGRVGLIHSVADVGRNGELLDVVRARSQAGVGRVANRHHRELEGRRIGEQALVVPLGASDRPPVGTLEHLGHADRALARRVVGVGEDGQRGAGVGVGAILHGVVLDADADVVIVSLDGLDADIGQVGGVGEALVGVGDGLGNTVLAQPLGVLGKEVIEAVFGAANGERRAAIGSRAALVGAADRAGAGGEAHGAGHVGGQSGISEAVEVGPREDVVVGLEDVEVLKICVTQVPEGVSSVLDGDGIRRLVGLSLVDVELVARDASRQRRRALKHVPERGVGHLIRDCFFDRVVEVGLPLAGRGILDEVVLGDLDVAEVDLALGGGERLGASRHHGVGRGRLVCRVVRAVGLGARHRNHREVNAAILLADDGRRIGVVVVLNPRGLLDARKHEGELVLFGMARAVLVGFEPAAALEVLDRAHDGRAVGGVLGGVGNGEADNGQAISVGRPARFLIANQLVKHGVGGRRLMFAVLCHHIGVAAIIGLGSNLKDAIGVGFALAVEERQLAEALREVRAIGVLVDGDRANQLPAVSRIERHALLGGLFHLKLRHVVGSREGLVRAVELNGHGIVRLLLLPVLGDGEGRVLGIAEHGRAVHVDARAGVGRKLRAQTCVCVLDLGVEAAVALVDDGHAQILGRVIVVQLRAVVVRRAGGDDLVDAVLEDVVLVAGRHDVTVGVREFHGAFGRGLLDLLGRDPRKVVDRVEQGREGSHTLLVGNARSVIIAALVGIGHIQAQVDAVAGTDDLGIVLAGCNQRVDGLRLGIHLDNLLGQVEGRADGTQDEEEVGVEIPLAILVGLGRPQRLGDERADAVVGGVAVGHGRGVGYAGGGVAGGPFVEGERRDEVAHAVALDVEMQRVLGEVVGHALVGVGVGAGLGPGAGARDAFRQERVELVEGVVTRAVSLGEVRAGGEVDDLTVGVGVVSTSARACDVVHLSKVGVGDGIKLSLGVQRGRGDAALAQVVGDGVGSAIGRTAIGIRTIGVARNARGQRRLGQLVKLINCVSNITNRVLVRQGRARGVRRGLAIHRLRVHIREVIVARAVAADALRQVASGHRVELGLGVVRVVQVVGFDASIRNLDDLVDRVEEVTGHEARALVEREVVDVDVDAVEGRQVLVVADCNRGAGRNGVGVVLVDVLAGNDRARHREAASALVVLGPELGNGLVRGSEVRLGIAVGVVGVEARGHELKGVCVGGQPAAALELLDDGGLDVGLRVVAVLDYLDEGAGRGGDGGRGVVSPAGTRHGLAVFVRDVVRVRHILLVRSGAAHTKLVEDADFRAVADLGRAVVDELALGVISREVLPLEDQRRNLGGRDGLVLIRSVRPGALVARRRGLLDLEGGVLDRRRAEAKPILEHVEGRGLAVDEVGGLGEVALAVGVVGVLAEGAVKLGNCIDVGAFLGALARAGVVGGQRVVSGARLNLEVSVAVARRQPLVLDHGVVARGIPRVLDALVDRAVAVVGGNEAHVDGLGRVDDASIDPFGGRDLSRGHAGRLIRVVACRVLRVAVVVGNGLAIEGGRGGCGHLFGDAVDEGAAGHAARAGAREVGELDGNREAARADFGVSGAGRGVSVQRDGGGAVADRDAVAALGHRVARARRDGRKRELKFLAVPRYAGELLRHVDLEVARSVVVVADGLVRADACLGEGRGL